MDRKGKHLLLPTLTMITTNIHIMIQVRPQRGPKSKPAWKRIIGKDSSPSQMWARSQVWALPMRQVRTLRRRPMPPAMRMKKEPMMP